MGMCTNRVRIAPAREISPVDLYSDEGYEELDVLYRSINDAFYF